MQAVLEKITTIVMTLPTTISWTRVVFSFPFSISSVEVENSLTRGVLYCRPAHFDGADNSMEPVKRANDTT
jgi:hypothetical protein